MSQRHSSGAAAQGGLDRLVHAVLYPKHDEAMRICEDVQKQLLDTATLLADAGADHADKVHALRAQYADILVLQHEMKSHKDCLTTVVGQQAEQQDPVFEASLNNALETLRTASQFDPDRTTSMRKFDAETGCAPAIQGNELATVGDEDDFVVVESNKLTNDKCPYTQRPVLELQHAVEDHKGYIYEKSAIMAEFRKAPGRPIKCPFAGTHHVITVDELKDSASVARERRRMLLQGSARPGAGPSTAQDDDAFDIDQVQQ